MHFIKYFILSLLFSFGTSHSFLTDPDAYNRVFQLRDCVGRECKQACPSIPRSPRNTQESPARVWSRGEQVRIRWAKNNHVTGFVRFALVPVRKMMFRGWHKKLSLYDGCWAQGRYNCTGDLCGADNRGFGFQRTLEIPTVFPDGDYVFGMVWYGGVRLAGADFFSDYWSCSHVRIEGGATLEGRYKPFFDIGDALRPGDRERNQCYSAINAPGVCPNDGCIGPASYQIPRRYRRRRGPTEYGVDDVLAGFPHTRT